MMNRILFGRDYDMDERVRAASDRAGHHTMILLFVFNLVIIGISLVIRKVELGIPSLFMVLGGGIFYLFRLLRNGVFSENTKPFSKGKLRAILIFSFAGLLFGASYQFLFWIASPAEYKFHPGEHLWSAAFMIVFWTLGMLLLFSFLAWAGERRIRRMEAGRGNLPANQEPSALVEPPSQKH